MVFSNAPPQRGVCILYTFVLLLSMKKLSIYTLLFTTLLFSFSCKKVSNNKLDGKWELSSATISSTYSSPLETSSQNFVFMNKIAQSTIINNGITVLQSFPYNEQLTFDRKSGKYFREINYTSTDTTYTTVSNPDNEPQEINVMQVGYSQYSISEIGTFSVTGNSGDVKKNSQLVMISTEERILFNIKRDFFPMLSDGNYSSVSMDIIGWTDANEELLTNQDFEAKTKGNSSEGTIYFVEGLKGGVMEMKSNTNLQTISFSGDTITTVKDQKLIYLKHRNFQ
jgi:hypothetical protein